MLKLTMVQGETINIGEDIRIQLASDAVYRTNILIDAPKDVKVKREQSAAVDEAKAEKPAKKNVIVVGAKRNKPERK